MHNLDFFEANGQIHPLSTDQCQEREALLSGGQANVLHPNWTTAYSEIKQELKTGDIILVHGKYPFSWVVELLQWSKWGHSAMVIKREDIDPNGTYQLPEEIMLWESNTDDQKVANLWGDNKGKVKGGPMLISLEARLQNSQACYEDVEIVHRPLHLAENIDFTQLPNLFNEVINKSFPNDKEIIHSIYLGRKYNRSTNDPLRGLHIVAEPILGEIHQLSADLDYILQQLPNTDDPNKEKIYCSELLAMTYKRLGLLTNTWVSNAYSPKDFSTEGTACLLKRAWLGSEMYLNMFA